MIHIDHQHREWPGVTLCPRPFLLQGVVQAAAVGQACQAIGGGEGGQLLLGDAAQA
ncbi:hypothetical protein D3C80_1933360 [compost metagenome]